jgi:diadenosine tetraphosphate (Ap4A) HIT family hydrolase
MAEYSTKTEKGDCIFCEIANGNIDTPGIFWKEYFDDVGRVGLIMEGTGIDHAHIKLFPMHNTSQLDESKWKQFHSKDDQYFETYPGYISSKRQ